MLGLYYIGRWVLYHISRTFRSFNDTFTAPILIFNISHIACAVVASYLVMASLFLRKTRVCPCAFIDIWLKSNRKQLLYTYNITFFLTHIAPDWDHDWPPIHRSPRLSNPLSHSQTWPSKRFLQIWPSTMHTALLFWHILTSEINVSLLWFLLVAT